MANEKLIIQEEGLKLIPESKAEKIKSAFEPMYTMLKNFESEYNGIMVDALMVIDEQLIGRAKRLRLDIGKVRIASGKMKDKQKEYIKLEDKAIMGVHNTLVWAIKEHEDELKEIEKHFDNLEAERLKIVQSERVEKLSLYVEDAEERDLSRMNDIEFSSLLAIKKKDYEDQIEAHKEAERIAALNKARSKEMAAENDRLKREAENDRLKELERKKAFDAEVLEQTIKRKEAEKLLKSKIAEEKKALDKIEAERQSKLNRNDIEKLAALKQDLVKVREGYSFTSDANVKIFSEIKVGINSCLSLIESNNSEKNKFLL
jgi:hypothetical protein